MLNVLCKDIKNSGQTDIKRKKSHVEVAAPPKNNTRQNKNLTNSTQKDILIIKRKLYFNDTFNINFI